MKPIFCLYVFLFILVSFSCLSKREVQNCNEIKKGDFYFYPRTSSVKYSIIRNGEFQKEVILGTKDTTYWKMNWIDDCSYTLDYVSGGPEIFKEYPHYKTYIRILDVALNYYIMNVTLEKQSMSETDTIWRSPMYK